MLFKQHNIFARCNADLNRCNGHPRRCNGDPEHRNNHLTRFLTWKSHGSLWLLEQLNITLLRLNATTLCSSVTTRCFAVLLSQQNISAQISNHPYHKRLAFGECAGVWSVCIGVLFHCDGYTASNQISLHTAETGTLPSFGKQSPISKGHWYYSILPQRKSP